MSHKQKGFAVISGSDSVVAKIMENGQVVFGQHKPVNMSISGTLTVDLPGAGSGSVDGRVFQVNKDGVVTVDKLAASNVTVSAIAGADGSDVQAVLETLASQVSANNNDLANVVLSLDSRLDVLMGGAESLEGVFSALTDIQEFLNGDGEGVGSLIAGIGDIATEVSVLKSEMADLQGDVGSLETALEGDISSLETALEGDISSLETALESDISSLETALESDISSLETALESDISSLETALEGDISSLETVVGSLETALEGDISSLETALEGDISSLETALEGDISSLETVVGSLETALEGDISSLETALEGDISSLETALEGDISSLETALEGDISSLETALESDINSLESRVEAFDVVGTENEISVSQSVDVWTVSLAPDVSITNSLTVNGSGSFKAVSNVLRADTDAGTLTSMAASPEDYNGMFFYLSGSHAGFEKANKWYFCEGDEWFPSPFFGE